jgi:uroporphyrin-3 C-methyltransferase
MLALLIALAAAAGTAYLWWLDQQNQGAESARLFELRSSIEQSQQQIASLREQLADQATSDTELTRDIGALEERLASQRRQLDELPVRLSRVEEALDEVPGIAAQSRAAWLVAEAEYYLRVANAQLQLARNPGVALRAMELADEKLRDVADPGLTPVRSRLADEMTALRALPEPDLEGLILRIGSLSRSLDQLPLSQQAQERYGQIDATDAELTGWARAWARIREAILSLVRIKQTGEQVTPLRTPAEESLLLRRLETTLELARLALLQGNGELYRELLGDVKSEMRRHFDTDAPAVRATVNELTDLARTDLPDALPDISGSLELLQQLGDGVSAS